MQNVHLLLLFLFGLIAVSISSSFPNLNEGNNDKNRTVIGQSVSNQMIYSAMNSLGKKQDVQEDFALQLSTSMSWEHLLSPAPLSIGLLGDLMIMSSEMRDFPIDGQLPQNGTIRYVKYPKSFRTTLVQISNDGQKAFMVAHNNMDKIRLLIAQVPNYMKEATDILVSGDQDLVTDYLPAPMNRIKEAAKSSASLSKEVVLQFEYVINLIFEVLEMCTSEKTVQEAKLQINFNRKSVLNKTLSSFEQMVNQMKISIAKDEEMMNLAEQDMRKALDDLPSEWDRIGTDFVQNMGNTLNTALLAAGQIGLSSIAGPGGIIQIGLQVASLGSRILTAKVGSPSQSEQGRNDSNNSPGFNIQEAIVLASNRDSCTLKHKKYVFDLNGMARHFQTVYNTLRSIDSVNKKYTPKQDNEKLKGILTAVKECEPLAQVINTGLEVIVKLKKIRNITDAVPNERHQTNLNDAMETVGKFKDISNNLKKWILSNQQPIAAKTPFLSSAQQQKQPEMNNRAANQRELVNCKYRAEMAQATLFAARQSIVNTRTQMIEQNLEFIKLLGEQQSLKLDEIPYDEIIRVLEEGIKKLSILKENWTKLVLFFQKIANLVENVANTQIEGFHTAVDTTAKNKIVDMLVFDMLYTKALKATQAASAVHNMAEIYINVSTDYIMPRISSLSRFVVTNRENARSERKTLLNQCTADTQAIVNLIAKEKEKMIEKLQKRTLDFQKEFSFLDQVRENKIEQIREKSKKEVIEAGTTNIQQIAIKVQKRVKLEVEKDEFLKENFILDDSHV